MVEYKCEHCGKICYARYKSYVKRFCSHECANQASWETRKRAEPVEFICQTCGKTFYVKQSDSRLSAGTIKYCSHACAGIASRKGAEKPCPVCGKTFYTTRNICCSPECARELKKRTNEHHAYYENGYLVEYKPGFNKKGNARQHRLIAEKMLGRPLQKDEVVHHINGDRDDNRPENLVIMKWGEHSRLHRMQEIESGKKLFEKK